MRLGRMALLCFLGSVWVSTGKDCGEAKALLSILLLLWVPLPCLLPPALFPPFSSPPNLESVPRFTVCTLCPHPGTGVWPVWEL